MEKNQYVNVFFITVLLQSTQSRSYVSEKTLLHWSQDHSNVVLDFPRVNRKCEEQGICDSAFNYPHEFVASLMEELKMKNITKFTVENPKAENGDYENICSFKEQIYYPRAAKDSFGDWHFILNGHVQPFQGFLVEICRKGCILTTLPFSSDYALNCVQRYVHRKMVYLDIYRRRLAVNNFKVPTCCSCSLVKHSQ